MQESTTSRRTSSLTLVTLEQRIRHLSEENDGETWHLCTSLPFFEETRWIRHFFISQLVTANELIRAAIVSRDNNSVSSGSGETGGAERASHWLLQLRHYFHPRKLHADRVKPVSSCKLRIIKRIHAECTAPPDDQRPEKVICVWMTDRFWLPIGVSSFAPRRRVNVNRRRVEKTRGNSSEYSTLTLRSVDNSVTNPHKLFETAFHGTWYHQLVQLLSWFFNELLGWDRAN